MSAWPLARGEDMVGIPGTGSAARLDEDVGALAVRLGPDEAAALAAAIPPGAAAGERYPTAAMGALQR